MGSITLEVRKTLEAEAAAGNAGKLLQAWRAEQAKAPTPKEQTGTSTFKVV